MCSDNK